MSLPLEDSQEGRRQLTLTALIRIQKAKMKYLGILRWDTCHFWSWVWEIWTEIWMISSRSCQNPMVTAWPTDAYDYFLKMVQSKGLMFPLTCLVWDDVIPLIQNALTSIEYQSFLVTASLDFVMQTHRL